MINVGTVSGSVRTFPSATRATNFQGTLSVWKDKEGGEPRDAKQVAEFAPGCWHFWENGEAEA